MAMNVIDAERMRSVSRELTGHIPFDADALTEMVRNELWARGVTTRRVLCERIASLARPLSDVKKDDVRSVLDEMERIGEVTFGPRGGLAVAPLRIVDAGNGHFRLFGTLPSRLVPNATSVGMARGLSDNSTETVAALMKQYGGVKLSPARWAGFDRVLPAGPEWLKQIEGRMEYDACDKGTVDGELNGIWMAYRPATTNGGAQSPWRKPAVHEVANLWRGWSIYGWPIHVWTSGGNPTESPSVRLTSDEANRTTFALCLRAGIPPIFQAEALGADVVLRFETYLPRAEYRYLMIVGVMQNLGGSKRAFRIPQENWTQVGTTLRERLGVTIDATGN